MAKAKAKATKNGTNGSIGKGREVMPPDLMAELQKDAVGYAANVKVTGEGNFLSTKGATFSIRGNVLGAEVEGVILSFSHVNQYYKNAFDPNKKGVTPDCFAISKTGEDMAPPDIVPDKQNPQCAGCWAADIGSASVGKGRACKPVARAAFILADDLETIEAASEAPILMISIPTMSKNNFTSYVKVLAENVKFKLPPYAVRVKVTITPHPQYQYTLGFSPIEPINNVGLIQALMLRARGEAVDTVMMPFQRVVGKDDKDADKKKGPGGAVVAAGKRKAALATSATRGGRSRFSS